MGRKPKLTKIETTTALHIRLPMTDFEFLTAAATQRADAVSTLIRELIRKAREKGEFNQAAAS